MSSFPPPSTFPDLPPDADLPAEAGSQSGLENDIRPIQSSVERSIREERWSDAIETASQVRRASPQSAGELDEWEIAAARPKEDPFRRVYLLLAINLVLAALASVLYLSRDALRDLVHRPPPPTESASPTQAPTATLPEVAPSLAATETVLIMEPSAETPPTLEGAPSDTPTVTASPTATASPTPSATLTPAPPTQPPAPTFTPVPTKKKIKTPTPAKPKP